MKNVMAVLLVAAAAGFFFVSCASEGYNTQKGAAIGAGLGAIAGQVIGHDTASTLIGAAVGTLVGGIGGNAVDQHVTNQRAGATQQPGTTAYPSSSQVTPQDQPPGQWVEVPGQWIGGKWVRAHKVWVPVNP
ncbi:MAG: YMGG-like glycine zipper-containing protein [Eubacteriales bacterium]|nr:YMGG-like glycine zipper-containing protein [Eubacteriales bacterium]